MLPGAHAGVGRTAPSTTGYPHPGTLCSALVAWLDARHHGARFVVRLEDLDRGRTRPAYVRALADSMAWLGLDVDAQEIQSAHAHRHERALDGLAARGLLYACSCTRARLRTLAGAVGDVGTAAYDNRCRDAQAPLSASAWRRCTQAVRQRLQPAKGPAIADSIGDPIGDPIVRRRDGSVGYSLAAVVDDAAVGVTRVVRGQDLAVHAPLHRRIYACLGLAAPNFYHHPLLWAQGADHKLAKLHQSAPIDPADPPFAAPWLLGQLGFLLGLAATQAPTTASALLEAFAWERLPAPTARPVWPGSAAAALPL